MKTSTPASAHACRASRSACMRSTSADGDPSTTSPPVFRTTPVSTAATRAPSTIVTRLRCAGPCSRAALRSFSLPAASANMATTVSANQTMPSSDRPGRAVDASATVVDRDIDREQHQRDRDDAQGPLLAASARLPFEPPDHDGRGNDLDQESRQSQKARPSPPRPQPTPGSPCRRHSTRASHTRAQARGAASNPTPESASCDDSRR